MKKLFFTLALAFSGLFANASNEVPAKKSIELQYNMVISNEKLSAEELSDVIYLGRYDVYVDGVYIGTYDVYLVVQ